MANMAKQRQSFQLLTGIPVCFSQCQYIAYWGLSEEAFVLPVELARTFVSHLEGCAGSINFLREHPLPCRTEPELFLKLKRTHRGETTEVMMQG